MEPTTSSAKPFRAGPGVIAQPRATLREAIFLYSAFLSALVAPTLWAQLKSEEQTGPTPTSEQVKRRRRKGPSHAALGIPLSASENHEGLLDVEVSGAAAGFRATICVAAGG